MIFDVIKGRRFVVLLGDEGAVLVHISGRQVRHRSFSPRPDREAAAVMIDTLTKEPATPVRILVDLMEQQYREVQIPRVGAWDRPKVVKRKLALAFPGENLTGALPGAQRADGSETQVLFAALPKGRWLQSWIDFLCEIGNPISGVSLLPIEAVEMIKALNVTAPEPGRDAGRWQLLLTRHRVSGYRQTIIQHNRLVLTRLTQALATDAGVGEVIALIRTDFAATLGYLRRLSFSDADRIELIVIADPEVCAGLAPRDLRIRHLRSLSPHQAAQQLGLLDVADPDDPYSDVLHAAFLSQRARPVLSLDLPQLRQTRLISELPRLVVTAGVVTAVAGIGYAGWSVQRQAELNSTRAALERTHQQLLADKRALEQATATLPVSPDQLAAILDADTLFDRAIPPYGDIVRRVAAALPREMVLESLNMARDGQTGSVAAPDDPAAAGRDDRRPAAPRPVDVVITVRLLTPPRDPQALIDRFRTFLATLRGLLDAYQVIELRAPGRRPRSGRLTGVGGIAVSSQTDTADRSEAVAEYRIRGPAP